MTEFTAFPIPREVVDIQETPKAAALPKARAAAPHIARGWIDPVAAVPAGSVLTIPDFMPIPDGWWPWAPAADGFQQICNWTPEALRIGNTDVRDLSIDPKGLFTDVDGLIPVTGSGATIAALRDSQGRRELHQAISAARVSFGTRPASGIRNILPANTANFLGTGWGTIRTSIAAATTSAIGEPAFDLTATSTDVNGAALSTASILAAGTYTVSAVVKGSKFFVIRPALLSNFGDAANAWFNLATGETGFVSLSGSASVFTGTPTSTITPVGDGAYRCTMTFTLASSAEVATRLYITDSNSSLPVTIGSTIRLEAPQLERAAAATPYQRRVSALNIAEVGQRALYYVSADGFDDWMALASPFAPDGPYTIAVAREWLTGWPAPLTFGSIAANSSVNFAQGISVTANTPSNAIGFPAAAGWPTTFAGRVDVIRIDGATSGQAWRNGTPYPEPPTITGAAFPIDGLDALFRFGSAFGSGRLYGGVMVDRAITEFERFMLQRYLAARGGIAL